MPAWPTMTDHFRDHRSATIPVGISNTNTAASMTVPDEDELEVAEPGRAEPVQGAMVNTSAETNAAVAAMATNTVGTRPARDVNLRSDQLGLVGSESGRHGAARYMAVRGATEVSEPVRAR